MFVNDTRKLIKKAPDYHRREDEKRTLFKEGISLKLKGDFKGNFTS